MAPHFPFSDGDGELEAAKRRLRQSMRVGGGDGGALIARLESLLVDPSRAVAFVWPLGGEPDLRPLMERFGDEGRTVLLPVVVGAGQALRFRRWRPGCPMQSGPFGTLHPACEAEAEAEAEVGDEAGPDDILVPLVAFDGRRHRLGRGGGFYDRTLAARPAARAIGFAFSGARVRCVPVGPHDRVLDVVVTDVATIGRGSV